MILVIFCISILNNYDICCLFAGSRGSTISEGQQGINYYQEHTDIDRPDGRVTPEGGAVPFDENYKCTYCGKRYRKNQRLYYTRHMEELEQRCPKYVQSQSTADPKDNNDLSKITSS